MKILTISSIIVVLVASIYFAPGTIQAKENIEGKVRAGIPTLTGMVIAHFIVNADALDLTDKQKKELSIIHDQYIFPMAKKEAESKISRIKVAELLRDPNFNPDDVKAEFKTFKETVLEINNMSIEALVKIRKVVGLEKFTDIWSMKNIQ